ncbi:MAG: hypothetical protein QM723_01025 [Myxococcaceae bacterium]
MFTGIGWRAEVGEHLDQPLGPQLLEQPMHRHLNQPKPGHRGGGVRLGVVHRDPRLHRQLFELASVGVFEAERLLAQGAGVADQPVLLEVAERARPAVLLQVAG